MSGGDLMAARLVLVGGRRQQPRRMKATLMHNSMLCRKRSYLTEWTIFAVRGTVVMSTGCRNSAGIWSTSATWWGSTCGGEITRRIWMDWIWGRQASKESHVIATLTHSARRTPVLLVDLLQLIGLQNFYRQVSVHSRVNFRSCAAEQLFPHCSSYAVDTKRYTGNICDYYFENHSSTR